MHYRLVNIGIKANNFLACYKVVFLAFLIITGFFEICIKGGKGKLLGIHDFGPTQTTVSDTNPQCFTDYDWSEPTKIQGIPIVKPGAATGVVNGVTALLLVFFSYSGWENASKYACILALRNIALTSCRLRYFRDPGYCSRTKETIEARCVVRSQCDNFPIHLIQSLLGKLRTPHKDMFLSDNSSSSC